MPVTTTIPVVGEPVAWAIGLFVLVLLVVVNDWVTSPVTIAHEGGHMALAVLTGRGHRGFKLSNGNNAATTIADPSFGVGDWFVTIAGYLTPPLLGLGGAYALVEGKVWSVLWAGVILYVAAFFQARNGLSNAVTILVAAGTAWAAVAGSLTVQTSVAVGLVWLMLLGGLTTAVRLSRADGSDAYWLATRTLIPRIVWHALWVFVAVLCLWSGGRRILGL